MQAITTIGFDRTINVRSWGKTGQHMLALSLTAFDPKETLWIEDLRGRLLQ